MDTDQVIDLANTAAESVLRFHMAAAASQQPQLNNNKPPPFVAIKAFKAAIHRTISQSVANETKKKKKKKKKHSHGDASGQLSVSLLPDVASSLAGDAAFRAATEWNSISHPENHVRPEWFRICVRTLVDGAAVPQVVDQVHHTHQLKLPEVLPPTMSDLQEYLDPSGDLLMLDAPCKGPEPEAVAEPDAQQEASAGLHHYYYYGLDHVGSTTADPATADEKPLAHTLQEEPGAHNNNNNGVVVVVAQPAIPPLQQQSPPSSFIQSAWKAINHYAAHPLSSNAAMRCQATLTSLVPRERAEQDVNGYDDDDDDDDNEDIDLDEDEDDDDEDDDHDQHHELSPSPPAKIRRPLSNKGLSHHNKMAPSSTSRKAPTNTITANDSALMPRSGNARKPSKQFWTKQEEIALVSARQEGKTWNAIHQLLGTRTATACEKKYRDLNLSSHQQPEQQQQQQQVQSTLDTDNRREEEEDPAANDEESGDEEMHDDADTEDNV